jgi:hypothetical protein
MSRTITINGLTYNTSTHYGECGVIRGKNLYFPFFLMGTCGDERGVVSWNGKDEVLVAPKKMNYNWFKLLAMKIKANPYSDWDWCSFSKNILKPNREHLKTELNIDDEKVDAFLQDGYVFINSFDGSWEQEGEEYEEGEVGFYPNFKNFLEKALGELEY